jgi:hypothetical protein
MTRPHKTVFDCATGIQEDIPLTDEEIAEGEANRAAYLEEVAAQDAEKARIDALKASAKTKLVAGEPLTEEEAATIVL